MKSIAATAVTALMLAAVCPSIQAASNLSDVLQIGEHWYGDNYNMEDLKGRVVLYEVWGFN